MRFYIPSLSLSLSLIATCAVRLRAAQSTSDSIFSSFISFLRHSYQRFCRKLRRHILPAIIDLSQQIRRYCARRSSTLIAPARRGAGGASQLSTAGPCTSGVIKEHIFPSLSDFDLIFIALRREQARRAAGPGTVRAEFNAILRLIRTFKAVNEDWPHVPSASNPFSSLRLLDDPVYALPPRAAPLGRARTCSRKPVPRCRV